MRRLDSVHVCHSLLGKGNSVLYLSWDAQSDGEKRLWLEKFWGIEGPEVKSRRESGIW